MTTTEIAKNVLIELAVHSNKTVARSVEATMNHQNKGMEIMDRYANAKCHEMVGEIKDYFIDYGEMHSREVIKPVKPTHGNCCTCQTCGVDHDYCVCSSNKHNVALDEIAKKHTNKPL